MRKRLEFPIDDIEHFQKQLVVYASRQKVCCVLNSNHFSSSIPGLPSHGSFNFLAAFEPLNILPVNKAHNPFDSLYNFWHSHKDWIFGHFSYDLKNKIENLSSDLPDRVCFPEIFFFRPAVVIDIQAKNAIVWFTENNTDESISELISSICDIVINEKNDEKLIIQSRLSKDNYLKTVEQLKHHIQQGDIYEINFCQEFYAEKTGINTASVFNKICRLSPAPFACYYKVEDSVLISASPERFLKKTGSSIISQPMKGTSKKGKNPEENQKLIKTLSGSRKEQSENIMIVDIVRNDLSQTALPETVKVEEMCGIYEFPGVFQMISTIRSEISDSTRFSDVVRCAFPMGSMTGAPKIRAMELIETYEKTRRGLYSGSVGYIQPGGDFDFNVVIRSIQYHLSAGYLSFITGGAITIESDAVKEFDECLLKAEGILLALNGKLAENP